MRKDETHPLVTVDMPAGGKARPLDCALVPDGAEPDAEPDTELDAIRALFGADFAELARLFRTDSPARIAALRQAGAAGDWLRCAGIAHAFSGSSASIGAGRLATLCLDLELRARAGTLHDFDDMLVALEAEYLRFSSRLRATEQDEHR